MHKVERKALVSYAKQQMYALVDDVNAYPDFLPWCKQAEVHNRDDSEMIGSLTIAKGPFNQKLITRNTLKPHDEIIMHLVDGPFKQFRAVWQFHALDAEACRVSFVAEFTFKNKLLDIGLGMLFDQIASAMLDAFCRRAKTVYG